MELESKSPNLEFKVHYLWQYDDRLKPKQKVALNALAVSLCMQSAAIRLLNTYFHEQYEADNIPQTDRMYFKKNILYQWIENDPVFKEYYDEIYSDVREFGEECLLKGMMPHKHKKTTTRKTKDGEWVSEVEEWETPGDKTLIIFFNKTVNKHKYTERLEVTTPEGIQVNGMAPVVLNINSATIEEADERS